jgi:hypothetical protein
MRADLALYLLEPGPGVFIGQRQEQAVVKSLVFSRLAGER